MREATASLSHGDARAASAELVASYALLNAPEHGAPESWGTGISNIGFFDVAAAGALAPLGIVSSGDIQGTCARSCTNGYGNTRPIFLGDRAFALMGSELAEVTVRPAVAKGAVAVLE